MDSRTTWPSLIGALIRGDTLTSDETSWAMNEIMDGAATPSQIAAFGVALRAKGETAGEVSGLAQAMLAHATPLRIPGLLTDLVGTGGDGARTVNISTMGTIVAPRPRGWPSTVTGRHRPPAARRMCSRRSGW
jgi:anthranilate phosphoribosyltransferase